jgi:hypothetical protein
MVLTVLRGNNLFYHFRNANLEVQSEFCRKKSSLGAGEVKRDPAVLSKASPATQRV